ncbi:MAG TPA: UDP-N-acetylglucosamine 2-epimerase (non-hydrolyzing) [Planctomycetaceae bacterium]
MHLMLVAGARPNFMKIAPLTWELKARSGVDFTLVHTGQHYDRQMSELFFEQLEIPEPAYNLGVGSGTHAVQTAEIIRRFEPVVIERRPDAVVVVGDVNSTVACALTAVKLGIPVAHVEAGLRSFDRSMPEEINRVVTDAISDWLFVSEPSGVANLENEGVPAGRIHFVGNVMIDTLLAMRDLSERSDVLQQLAVDSQSYSVVTLHRPTNVDEPAVLSGLLQALARVAQESPIIFPVHPRTRAAVQKLSGADLSNIRLIEPLGYLEFMKLVAHARLVLTDSGGLQEETTILGIPCLTLRKNTERPVTVAEGTNTLVGMDPAQIVDHGLRALRAGNRRNQPPRFWDGQAAKRVIDVLLNDVTRGRSAASA